MMDNFWIFSDAQTVSDVDAVTTSTDKVNQGAGYDCWGSAAKANVGERGWLWLNVTVDTAFTSPGSGNLKASLMECATESGSYTSTGVESKEFAATELTAGASVLRIKLPPDLLQYLQLYYTVSDSRMSAGKLNAWVGPDSATPQSLR